MSKRSWRLSSKRVAVIVSALTLVSGGLIFAEEPLSGASSATITGTGSSYAALAINQWVAEVASLYGDNINYSTQSSVIGLNDFAQYPQVDFGASEIGYSSNQADQLPPAGFNYQYLPDIAGAECMDYNVNNSVGQQINNLKLNPTVLLGIFTGRITNWNDKAISALNPGVLLPNTSIVVVFRTDASGDNYIFSNYLSTLASSTWNSFTSALQSPAGAQAVWPQPPSSVRSIGPYQFGNWTGESGSDNASNYVYQTNNSITYVETGYAILHHDPCAAISNASGAYVQPSEAGDAIALQNDQLQANLEQNLTPVFESPQSNAYPISAYSYLVMADQTKIPPAKQSVEAQFVQFLACQGQESAGKLGYSPLPLNLVEADFSAVKRIDGVTLPTPTAANCPDPYITGSFNAVAASTSGSSASSSGGSGQSDASKSGASTGTNTKASSTVSNVTKGKKNVVSIAPPPGVEPGVDLQHATATLAATGMSGTLVYGSAGILAALVALPPVLGLLRRRKSQRAAQS